jgi:hypothetical protein
MRTIQRYVRSGAAVIASFGAMLYTGTPASAQNIVVTGRLLLADGHEQPACRRLLLRDDNGTNLWFRLPDTGADNSILAVSLAALGSGKKVQIAYHPTLTSGCGTEPRVLYITIMAD